MCKTPTSTISLAFSCGWNNFFLCAFVHLMCKTLLLGHLSLSSTLLVQPYCTSLELDFFFFLQVLDFHFGSIKSPLFVCDLNTPLHAIMPNTRLGQLSSFGIIYFLWIVSRVYGSVKATANILTQGNCIYEPILSQFHMHITTIVKEHTIHTS
jgi:hypothetical protein